jgi:hypothetical protein
MQLLNKKIKTESQTKKKDNSPEKNNKYKGYKEIKKPVSKNTSKKVIVKKKRKLGFGSKKAKIEKKPDFKEVTTSKEEPIEEIVTDITTEESDTFEEIPTDKKPFTSKKKKSIIKKDVKGKTVYLEDTGEKLGIVFDTIYDKDDNIVGYKIKDKKTDAVLSFPSDQFDDSKDGLIFVPGWYTSAIKTIEQLEFKDKISPDLTALLTDDAVSNEELYEIFVKHDNDMAKYVQDAISLKEMLTSRLKALEKQRIAMKEDLMNLTERRLIKDIDRREFSEDVIKHRRKVNILDININKCKNLMKRLENTSFGVLGINYLDYDRETKVDQSLYSKNFIEELQENKKSSVPIREEETYKSKYYELKEQFDQLEDNYQELKTAVDKLFNKD